MCMSGGRVWELSGRIAPGSTVPDPGTDDSGSVYSDFTPCTECEDQGLESGDTVSSEKRNIIIILDQGVERQTNKFEGLEQMGT